DDGSRAARVTAAHVRAWVDVANRLFEPAGFELRFDHGQPLDELQSSIVNRAMPDRQVEQLDAALQPLLERHPGELLVVFRHGPEAEPTTLAFSGLYLDYIVMPGFEGTHHCGDAQLDALAHELGHFLGLPHTFAQQFDRPSDAAAFLRARRLDPMAFDGDGIADTLPDPGIAAMECTEAPSVDLAGVRFELPRGNLMSYYAQRSRLSPTQIERARWTMAERMAHGMRLAVNEPTRPLELEAMPAVGPRGCRHQSMTTFLDRRWSGDAQQFCEQPSRFRFVVERTGRYRLRLFATRAPDFGQLQVTLDGEPLGGSYEAWAPVVLPSGPIALGEKELGRGAHTIGFRTVGRHPKSSADKYGVDALELSAIGRWSP
ncbi:MAG: hypothetical protein JRI55_30600, partial [Deltaproteobacteria bacterium]|nr:hypothetical protein [Deltaproteobacteria bacterium]